MKSLQVFSASSERVFVIVLAPGDEAFQSLSDFARDKQIKAASLTAIGAFAHATLGWFDLQAKEYRPIQVNEQCEALSFVGDVADDDDGRPSLHLHGVVGLSDGSTRGGHLLKATVNPTLEVTLTETPAHLHRRKQVDLGIALIALPGGG